MVKGMKFFCVLTSLVLFLASPSFLWAENCDEAKRLFNESLNTGNKARQEELLRKAIELCPTFAEAYNNLGLVLEEKGELDEALEAYKKSSEVAKNFPHPFAGMGDVYRKKNNCVEAIKAYSKFLKLSSDIDVKQKYPDVVGFVSYVEGNLKECEAKLKPNEKAMLEASEEDSLIASQTIAKALTQKTRGINAVPSIPIKINFATNSAEISKSSFAQLEEIAKALNDPALVSSRIAIEGHTDNVGDPSYNLELSKKRAESVKRYLVENFQIDPKRLETRGFGASRPIASNDTVWGRAQNRRVELVNLGPIEEAYIQKQPVGSQQEKTESQPEVEPIKIAILELDSLDRTGRQDPIGRMISEFLTTSAVESKRFDVVERSLLDKVMKELELGQSGLIEEGKAREIGRMVGASTILTGSVSRMGNTLRIDVRLIDVESGKILAAANELTEGDLQSVSRASGSLINKLIARLK